MGMADKRGWAVEERAVMPEELDEASEVFLCGTAAETRAGRRDRRAPLPGRPDDAHADGGLPDAGAPQPDSEGFGESTHLAPPVDRAA